MRYSLTTFLLALLAASGPALAASSSWVSTEGGKLRLVALRASPDGIIRGFLEIVPDDGWHTYWKVPGSGGIPPQIMVKPGGNADLVATDFPPPRVFESGNLRDFGYDAGVRLPLTFRQPKLHESSTIAADIFVGLCAKICVPFQTSLSLRLDDGDTATPAETALVKAALASLPEGESTDFKITETQPAADGKSVNVSILLPPGSDAASAIVIASTADGEALAKPSLVSSSGQTAIFSLTGIGSQSLVLKGKTIDILVQAAGRAMETTVKIP